MGNHTTTEILHEEDEPSLHIDENSYEIRSVITDTHNKDTLGRPVIVFDRWKILQSDLNNTHNKSSLREENLTTDPETEKHEKTSSNSGESSTRLSSLDTLNNINSETQKNHSSSTNDMKSSVIRKPRPNSLAIVSLSCDSVNIPNSSHTQSNQEVSQCASGSIQTNLVDTKSASADTLLEPRPGLQQRRNRRPTSLQIPSLTNISNIPPPPVRTALNLQSHNFKFTR